MGIELNEDQLFTAMDMEHWFRSGTKQTYEISGAAGTGKTTMVLYLIEQLGLSLDEVLFMAYMGKAATQLARHGLPAKTIRQFTIMKSFPSRMRAATEFFYRTDV